MNKVLFFFIFTYSVAFAQCLNGKRVSPSTPGIFTEIGAKNCIKGKEKKACKCAAKNKPKRIRFNKEHEKNIELEMKTDFYGKAFKELEKSFLQYFQDISILDQQSSITTLNNKCSLTVLNNEIKHITKNCKGSIHNRNKDSKYKELISKIKNEFLNRNTPIKNSSKFKDALSLRSSAYERLPEACGDYNEFQALKNYSILAEKELDNFIMSNLPDKEISLASFFDTPPKDLSNQDLIDKRRDFQTLMNTNPLFRPLLNMSLKDIKRKAKNGVGAYVRSSDYQKSIKDKLQTSCDSIITNTRKLSCTPFEKVNMSYKKNKDDLKNSFIHLNKSSEDYAEKNYNAQIKLELICDLKDKEKNVDNIIDLNHKSIPSRYRNNEIEKFSEDIKTKQMLPGFKELCKELTPAQKAELAKFKLDNPNFFSHGPLMQEFMGASFFKEQIKENKIPANAISDKPIAVAENRSPDFFPRRQPQNQARQSSNQFDKNFKQALAQSNQQSINRSQNRQNNYDQYRQRYPEQFESQNDEVKKTADQVRQLRDEIGREFEKRRRVAQPKQAKEKTSSPTRSIASESSETIAAAPTFNEYIQPVETQEIIEDEIEPRAQALGQNSTRAPSSLQGKSPKSKGYSYVNNKGETVKVPGVEVGSIPNVDFPGVVGDEIPEVVLHGSLEDDLSIIHSNQEIVTLDETKGNVDNLFKLIKVGKPFVITRAGNKRHKILIKKENGKLIIEKVRGVSDKEYNIFFENVKKALNSRWIK